MTSPLEQFHTACRAVLADSKAPSLNYAIGYARAGLTMHITEECRVQALYIVNNITHWRHPQAKEVRAILKKLGDRKGWAE